MKKIFMIMLVLLTVGVAFGLTTGFNINNRSNKDLLICIDSYDQEHSMALTLFAGSSASIFCFPGFTCTILAIVGNNVNLRIPGYYEFQTYTVGTGSIQDNNVDFYFSHFNPVDPVNPGQNQ